MKMRSMKIKSKLILLVNLIFISLILFLFFDIVSVLLGSLIIYFEKGFFPFSWSDVFASFFKSGYVGALILSFGVWIKICLKERKKSTLSE